MKILYFTDDFSRENIQKIEEKGLIIRKVPSLDDGALEECDAVCGDVPERYRESYPIYDLKTGSLTVPQQSINTLAINPIVKILTGKATAGHWENSPAGLRLVLTLPEGTTIGNAATIAPTTTINPSASSGAGSGGSSAQPVPSQPTDAATSTAELKRVIVFFGDSTNARIGGRALNIAKGQDYTVINNAQGGSLAAYALMSMNGSPITVTFDVAEIPAKGAGVNVPATLTYGEGVTPFSMHSTVVIIDDRIEAAITGQTTSIKVIPRDNNTHAVEPGKAYTVKLKANGSTDGICVIATGKNDINGANIGNWQAALERVKTYVQKCVAQVEPQNNKRFIVLTNWADQSYNYETHGFRKDLIDGYNTWLKTTYGNKVFDVEAYVLGSQVWTDLGIQADETSLASQAAGKLPVALSSDGGSHLSEALEAKVAEKIIEQAKSLGYL